MSFDIFISYSSQDKPRADAICARLESRNIRCWIAPRDVLPGSDYASSIVDAIDAARAMVVVFSQNANNSNHLKKEVERAVSKGLPIVPVRIEDVMPDKSMEYYMSTQHWLDAITEPFDQHIDHLANSLAALISKPSDKKASSQRPHVKASASVPPPPSPPVTTPGSKSAWLLPALGGGVAVLAILYFIGTPTDHIIQIDNLSSHDIYQVYIDSSAQIDYSTNLLTNNILASGGSEVFTGFAEGVYDMRLVNDTGLICDFLGNPLDTDIYLTLTDDMISQQCGWSVLYNIQIDNLSRYNFLQVYIDQTQMNFSANRLGNLILASGQSLVFPGHVPGTYTIRVINETGDICDFPEFPIFENTSFALTDDILFQQCGRAR